jgi:hypothetical protein
VIWKVLGYAALACSVWGVAICGAYLRKPGQPEWGAWKMLAASTVGCAISGLGLLLLS